ncbi:hypothetical protein [Cryobacterium cryoconiti]|uniref:Uncharacterized protein n=1 Tax=Cryobacterium cryoconiti TaxID=1259239 RepID=A0A4Y8JR56_9MICO|nr:hypothetical protein [Cryobacterium cryoconiti]TFD27053.1 hypothetical protein E3T49_14305 [Cryobacterium cryoconiti]
MKTDRGARIDGAGSAQLEQLTTDYFVATDSLEEIDATAHAEIVTIQEHAAQQSAAARTAAAAVIESMLELGTPKAEVAGRLGLALRDIKKSPNL